MNKKNLIGFFIPWSISTLVLFLLVAHPLFGVTACNSGGSTTGIQNPICANDLPDFIKQVLATIGKIGGSIVIVAIVYSGMLFVTAQGNEEKLKKAKNAITYTLVGAAIALGAGLIANVVANTINAVH